MDNEMFRVAVGLPLCQAHLCSSCGVEVDELGNHGLSCRFSKGRSGAWLNALPISSLSLRMDNKVFWVAVGLPLCQAHLCSSCGVEVGELGTNGLSCRFSKGRLEPTGLYRDDGKRPDGATVVPWKWGKVLVWDVTCLDTLAPSYSSLAIRESGAVAADAKYRKRQKYAHLVVSFQLRWRLSACLGWRLGLY